MSDERTELMELIEEVDMVDVNNHPVLLELMMWLPTDIIQTFIEDAKTTLDIGFTDIEPQKRDEHYTTWSSCD